MDKLVGLDGLPLGGNQPADIVSVQNGQVIDTPKRGDTPLDISQFEELAVSIIEFLNHPKFPSAPVTTMVRTEVMEVNGAAGASEVWVRIAFKTERQVEWFVKMGMLAKIIAENATGHWPRKVSLINKYDEKTKTFLVALEIGCLQVRVAKEGRSGHTLGKDDLDIIS